MFSKTARSKKSSENANVPAHIGIIMDGNRRFAKKLMLEPWRGHEWGASKAEELLDWCCDLGVKNITLYSLSYENFKSRPKQELDVVLSLIEKEALRVAKLDKVHNKKVKFNVIGRPDMLPESVQSALRKLVDATKDYNGFTVNLAIAYGGRQEILEAAKKVALEAKNGRLDAAKLDESSFRKFLYTNGTPDPDLIIRTGGEKRVSGFLLWQSAYSELFFSDKMWPDFGRDDLVGALDEFAARERRFGQ